MKGWVRERDVLNLNIGIGIQYRLTHLTSPIHVSNLSNANCD